MRNSTSKMAEPSDLKHVLKETLENRGAWKSLKSQLTAEVFNVLDDKTISKPDLPQENFLINELIREYLLFNNYKYTNHVLIQETGQPKEALPRDILAKDLLINEDHSNNLPLIYTMLIQFTKNTTEVKDN